MFDILTNLTKAVVGVVVTPVDMVADLVTLGGVTTGQDECYTAQRLDQVLKNLNKATE